MVAAKLAKMPRGANQHTPIGGPSQSSAAQMLNVGVKSVERARTVERDGAPELVSAVESGAVKVPTAADIATFPKPEQVEIVARGEKEILEAAKKRRPTRN